MQIVETISMKCQILFSGKNKKNIINISYVELAERLIKVKEMVVRILRELSPFSIKTYLVVLIRIVSLPHKNNVLLPTKNNVLLSHKTNVLFPYKTIFYYPQKQMFNYSTKNIMMCGNKNTCTNPNP